MNEKKITDYSELTLHDLLTVDVYDKVIKIRNAEEGPSESLVSKKQFFNKNGLYVEPESKGLRIITDTRPTGAARRKQKDDNNFLQIDDLLKEIERSPNSYVLLIEGYAGCGKSTLVQAILARKIGFVPDYTLYNYNIEEQNNAVIHDDKGNKIANSSIFNAIKKCFIIQFCKHCKKVINDFIKLTELCKEYPPLSSVYWLTNTYEFDDAVNNIKENNIRIADRVLYSLLSKTNDDNCILAFDYLLRLAMWKNRLIDDLYICYDNLDAIEDAADLKEFDDKLIAFRELIDDFVDNNSAYFNFKRPCFVILATYRKITSVLAELDRAQIYNEVNADIPGVIQNRHVLRIDATSTFSYRKIVSKRKDFFEQYFEKQSFLPLDAKKQEVISKEMQKLANWDELNKTLEIMKDRYSILWNRNYRTCSLIAQILFSSDRYDFSSYITFIKKYSTYDGYQNEQDDNGNNILCTYYGGSAILLSCVCRVFNDYGVWNDLLKLTHLHLNAPELYTPSYKNVSLSRLILTYIYNEGVVSLEEMYASFCSKGLFSIDELCTSLSNMVARDKAGIWRRPIYYYSECILAVEPNDICEALKNECQRIKMNSQLEHSYSFQLCDSGQAYVERLMSEFEFFSNRLSNGCKPLYMYNNISDLREQIHNVFCAVSNCCSNMIAFKEEYTRRYNVSTDDYLRSNIHPKTNRGSYQLHTERIIFAHIAYLNNVRLFFVDKKVTSILEDRIQYNEVFVDSIREYLNLYQNLISKISKDRWPVYEKLSNIVSEIEEERRKEKQNLQVLFKTISLSHKTKSGVNS